MYSVLEVMSPYNVHGLHIAVMKYTQYVLQHNYGGSMSEPLPYDVIGPRVLYMYVHVHTYDMHSHVIITYFNVCEECVLSPQCTFIMGGDNSPQQVNPQGDRNGLNNGCCSMYCVCTGMNTGYMYTCMI